MMPRCNNGYRSKSREHARRGDPTSRDALTATSYNPIAWDPFPGEGAGGGLSNAEVAARITQANQRWEAILMASAKAKKPTKSPRRPRAEVTRRALRDYRAAWRSIRTLMRPVARKVA